MDSDISVHFGNSIIGIQKKPHRTLLGWGLGKKHLPIDQELWEHMLEAFWPKKSIQILGALLFYGIAITNTVAASRNLRWKLQKIFPNNASILCSNYTFYHTKTSLHQVIEFGPWVLAFKAAAPKISLIMGLDFFGYQKPSICQHDVPP